MANEPFEMVIDRARLLAGIREDGDVHLRQFAALAHQRDRGALDAGTKIEHANVRPSGRIHSARLAESTSPKFPDSEPSHTTLKPSPPKPRRDFAIRLQRREQRAFETVFAMNQDAGVLRQRAEGVRLDLVLFLLAVVPRRPAA